MKKGYCTACKTHDEARRIFEVNSETKYCYCPRCLKKYRPRVAIHNYERTIKHYIHRANYFLKNTGEAKLAYNLFAYTLELEPSNRSAKLGRMLSLAYISTLRRNRFLEIKEMLMIEKDLFQSQYIRKEYIAFLINLDLCINKYINRSKKRITIKKYFYDAECFKLYLKNINDAIELKRLIINELSNVEEEKWASQTAESIKILEAEYNKPVVAVNGDELHLVNFTKEKEPLIATGPKKKKVDEKVKKYRMASLTPDKKLRYIDDIVFSKVPHRIFVMMNISPLVAAASGTIGIALLVLFFVFINNWFAPFLIVNAILFIIVALVFVGLRFIFQLVLKKPRF